MTKPEQKRTTRQQYSKQLITDTRYLLWIVTLGGLALAALCIVCNYDGNWLPWITAMVGLPWSAHGTICCFYLNMSKSDHKTAEGTGITALQAILDNQTAVAEYTESINQFTSDNSSQTPQTNQTPSSFPKI